MLCQDSRIDDLERRMALLQDRIVSTSGTNTSISDVAQPATQGQDARVDDLLHGEVAFWGLLMPTTSSCHIPTSNAELLALCSEATCRSNACIRAA